MWGDWFSFCGGVWLSGCFWWVRIIQGSLKKGLLVFGKIKQVDRRGLATSRRRSILFIALDTAVGFQAAVGCRKKQSFQAAFG